MGTQVEQAGQAKDGVWLRDCQHLPALLTGPAWHTAPPRKSHCLPGRLFHAGRAHPGHAINPSQGAP